MDQALPRVLNAYQAAYTARAWARCREWLCRAEPCGRARFVKEYT